MTGQVDFSKFEQKIGIVFANKNLLRQAFTHRSHLNENPHKGLEHNERLEFLGDAVLEIIVTEYLFREYPEKDEGDLTAYRAALVNAKMFADVAQQLGMNDFLLLSRGEARDVGKARQYILANTFEAFIGALYLDQPRAVVVKFITDTVLGRTGEIISKRLWQDAKSLFQEKAQEAVSSTPSYKVLKESGPDHDKHFTVGVFLGETEVAQGSGKSKQEAEQAAATSALVKKKWNGLL